VAVIQFTPWFIKASRRGHDTVGSLVDFIDERLSQIAPARSNVASVSHASVQNTLDVEAA
jgi:hypothetical protein